MEKAHMEVLLEDIRGKFDLVLEGHAALHAEIRATREDLGARIDHNSFQIDVLNQKIDSVEQRLEAKINSFEQRLEAKIGAGEQRLEAKLDAVSDSLAAHRRDTEAHHGYRVGE